MATFVISDQENEQAPCATTLEDQQHASSTCVLPARHTFAQRPTTTMAKANLFESEVMDVRERPSFSWTLSLISTLPCIIPLKTHSRRRQASPIIKFGRRLSSAVAIAHNACPFQSSKSEILEEADTLSGIHKMYYSRLVLIYYSR